jgi:hypothetical protein
LRRTLFFIVFILGYSYCPAQWSDTLNSIIHGKVSSTASFDSRNSFINASKAHIWGVKIGVEFSDRLQGGIGYNRHDKNLSKEILFLDQAGLPHSTKAFLHLSYFSFYLRYAYYNNNKWKFSIMPYQLGCGNSYYQYVENGNKIIIDRQLVVIYEPGISVSYKFFPWLGVGGDVGYRFMLRNNYAIPEKFNSPIFSFYGIIFWGELYKMVIHK